MSALTTNAKVEAFAAYEKNEPLKPFVYEPRPIGEHDVEIKIDCCGICHSDIHTIDSGWGPTNYPVVVGHEIVGKVVAKGSQATQFNIGDRVGVGAQCWACLEPACHECAHKSDNLCNRRIFTYNAKYEDGQTAYGGYAKYVRVQQDYAFSIPETLSSEEAAPLLCAGVTVYAPLKRHGVKAGVDCGIVGIGGLGHLAIQFAYKLGANVTAISTSPSKEAEAKTMGATRFLNTKDSSAVKTAISTLDVILCTASGGADEILGYMEFLRPNGKLIIVGVPESNVSFHPFQVIGGQKTIVGSLIGSKSEVKETLEFAAQHGVKPWIQVMNMDQCNEGIKLVRDNRVKYRVVLKN